MVNVILRIYTQQLKCKICVYVCTYIYYVVSKGFKYFKVQRFHISDFSLYLYNFSICYIRNINRISN